MARSNSSTQQQVSLDELAKHLQVKAESKETEEERDARIRRDDADARHKRWQDTMTYGLALAGLVYAVYFASSIALSSGASADDKKWAQTAIFSIVTAAIAYVAGRKSK